VSLAHVSNVFGPVNPIKTLIAITHRWGIPVVVDGAQEDHRVRGCQSTVFLAARVRPDSTDVVEFLADSDSEIVQGLLALLRHHFSGQRAAEILNIDLARFLACTGLASNLTTGHRNGLATMISRLHAFAVGLIESKSQESACREPIDVLSRP
jgi:sulfur transfer protein SufE